MIEARRYVAGPFRHGHKWRIVSRIEGSRRQVWRSFPTADEAIAEKMRMLAEHDDPVLGELGIATELPRDPTWVYLLMDGDLVMYVGTTRDPDGRRLDHQEAGVPFTRMLVYPQVMTRGRGLSAEAALIRMHNPPMNKLGKLETREETRRARPVGRPKKTVRAPGLEPGPLESDRNLNPACLPIPPRSQRASL